MEKTFEDDAIHYIDELHGIEVPKVFAYWTDHRRVLDRTTGKPFSEEDWSVLNDPANESYWDVWDEILTHGYVINESEERFYLYQDGGLWLVPEGVEVPEL